MVSGRVLRGAQTWAGPPEAAQGPEIGDVGQLGGVTNHLVVSLLLFRRKSELIPDVHPVTVVAVDALATNLNLNLSDELLTNEV